MKAYQSPLLKRMLRDSDASNELRKFFASSALKADIFFKGRYYTITKVDGEFA